MRALRKLLKWPLRAAVRNPALRAKLAWELREGNFDDLSVQIPLSHGVCCPIRRPSSVHSFSEVFIHGEYSEFLHHMPLPRRWLDLGCHAGYFSNYLAWQCRRQQADDFSALLIDADPRVRLDVEHMIRVNQFESKFSFRAGLIQAGSGPQPFGLRQAMASSSELQASTECVATVEILSSGSIIEAFAPPYDLIKLDVEGAEYDFIEHYGAVLSQARTLLVEWHSWDEAGTGEARLGDLLGQRSFERVAVLQECKLRLFEERPITAGCHLYRNIANGSRSKN